MIGTLHPGSLDNLDVSNTRNNRVVDLEGNPNTKTIPESARIAPISVYVLVLDTLLDRNCVLLQTSHRLLVLEVEGDLLSRWESGRYEFQS